MSRLAMLALGLVAAAAAWPSTASAQPATTHYLDSAAHPGLRVLYPDAVSQTDAQLVLDQADSSWDAQVTGMGYPPPATVDETDAVIPGLYIYLDPGSDMNYVEPVADNPSTPRTDCALYAVMASVSGSSMPTTVWHVFNHTMTMSADCGEVITAGEHTAVAVTALSFPADPYFKQYFLPSFQKHPFHGLHCYYMQSGLEYFHFGGGLFDLFLEKRYGSYDGKLLATIWQDAEQDGTVTIAGYSVNMSVPNSPNIVDATSAALAPQNVTFAEAFGEFAQWRYFVGTRDDGNHFTDGDKWTGAEVAIDASLTLGDLPVTHAAPADAPNAFGTVYIELDLGGLAADRGVHYGFKGDASVSWRTDVLLVRSDNTADVEAVPLDATGTGEIVLSGIQAYAKAVLVVSNLGPTDYDPDVPGCSVGKPFYYDLSEQTTALPPTITGVSPSELPVGATTYVWASGSDFASGISAAFSGDGIEVASLDFVDPTELGMSLAVGADAALGPRDLTVTNPDAQTGTLPGAVVVVAAGNGNGDNGVEPSGGCACSTVRTAASSPWRTAALLGLGLTALLRRRRSR
jgi:MYXO-CTERM domain-containing protein